MIDCKVLCSRLIIPHRYACVSYFKALNRFALTTASSPALTNKEFSSFVPDIIDEFAENLVKDKVIKWKHRKLRGEKLVPFCKNVNLKCGVADAFSGNEVSLETVMNSGSEALKQFISVALKDGLYKSVILLLQMCWDKKIELPPECLLEAASSFSRQGIVDGVKAVQTLCKGTNAYEYSAQGGYDHYLAEASWTSGHLQEALCLFTSVYEQNPNLHKRIRSMSRFLIYDVISRQGEAALVLVSRFATNFAYQHQDYHFLMILWQFCFLSDWFADQTLAANLLKEHSQLLNKVENCALEMCFVSLKSNRSEVVYRLLEVLLLYKMNTVYGQVLRALFDYKCDQGDARACSNIVQCCEQLGVPLTASQQHKFIYLVIKGRRSSRSKKLRAVETREGIVPPEFKLKF